MRFLAAAALFAAAALAPGPVSAPSARVPGLACVLRLPADVPQERDVPWLLAAPDAGAGRVRRAPETLFAEVENGSPRRVSGADGRPYVVLRTLDNQRAFYPAEMTAPWASLSDPAARCVVVRSASGLFGVGSAR